MRNATDKQRARWRAEILAEQGRSYLAEVDAAFSALLDRLHGPAPSRCATCGLPTSTPSYFQPLPTLLAPTPASLTTSTLHSITS